MINIRLAEVDEINELNKIITLSARELTKFEYTSNEVEAAIQYVFGVDKDLLADKTYFIIEKNNQIAGCGGWSKRKKLFGGDQYGHSASVYLDPNIDPAKIRAFFIHPDFARQGLGTMLLEHCEQDAQRFGFNSFEMMATLTGVKLYEKLGYIKISAENVILPNQVKLKFVRMQKLKT